MLDPNEKITQAQWDSAGKPSEKDTVKLKAIGFFSGTHYDIKLTFSTKKDEKVMMAA